MLGKVEDKIIDKEISCTFLDDDDCRFTFVYGYRNDTGELQVTSLFIDMNECSAKKETFNACRSV